MKNFIKTKLLYPILNFVLDVIDIINKFKKKKPTKYECINCKKIFEKPQKCECGSTRYIINPRKYRIQDNEILCGCKKGELKHECHCDCYNGFIEEFRCSRCFNLISIYQYIDFEDYKRTNKYILKEDDPLRNMPWNRNKI